MRVQLAVIMCKGTGMFRVIRQSFESGFKKEFVKRMILNAQMMYIQANRDTVSSSSSDYRHVITDVSQVTYVKITF